MSFRATFTVFLIALLPVAAAAQSRPDPGAAQAPAPAPQPVASAGENGFVIQSANGDFQLRVGVLAHLDGRFAPGDDSDAVINTFAVRRLRTPLRGRIARRFEFYVNPDFAGGVVVVQDAYLDTVFSPAFRVRLGKAKTPFGLERLQSVSTILFFERALPSALVPNRDVGVQVLGDLARGSVSYMAGVLNGVPDGGSADVDTNDSKDVAGRIVVRPFNARAATDPLDGLGLGFAATTGMQSGAAALALLRTSSLLQPFFSYAAAVADGRRTRYSPQAFYSYKNVAGFAEYVHTRVPVRKGAIREEIAHRAWQVAGSIVVTGEHPDAGGGVRPRANFNFGGGNWGAMQIGARYHRLRVDDAARTAGFAAAGSSVDAEAWTAGVNWFLTPNLRYVVNVERTIFDQGAAGARPAENALVFRSQLSF